jgi:hypothetical protein
MGVVTATAALGLNQMLIAMGAEIRMVGPWALALLAGATTVVLLGGEPTLRVVAGFVTGELIALAGLLVAVLTAKPTDTQGATDPPAVVRAPAALGE